MLVKQCSSCGSVNSSPPKARLHSWEEQEHNWQRLHIDYAGIFQGYYYLVVIDAKSKWAEIGITPFAPTSSSTIEMLLDLFARHGLPDVIASDNATIFTSSEFQSFCTRRGIFQKFIAPGHPATNGLAERNVQTLKRRLESMENDSRSVREKVRDILYRYRATPLANGKTPSEQYLNRQFRIQLDALKPPKFQNKTPTACCKTRQLSEGERVQARYYSNNKSLWKLATIIKKLGHLHYLVKFDEGYVLKRHINQLIATMIQQPEEDNTRPHDQPTPQTSEPIVPEPIPQTSEPTIPQPNLQDLVHIPTNAHDPFTDNSSVRNRPPEPQTERRTARLRRRPAYLEDYVSDA